MRPPLTFRIPAPGNPVPHNEPCEARGICEVTGCKREPFSWWRGRAVCAVHWGELRRAEKRGARYFTVIGFYPDSGQRFAETVYAEDANAAEDALIAKCGIKVCGVVEGTVSTCDERTHIDRQSSESD